MVPRLTKLGTRRDEALNASSLQFLCQRLNALSFIALIFCRSFIASSLSEFVSTALTLEKNYRKEAMIYTGNKKNACISVAKSRNIVVFAFTHVGKPCAVVVEISV
jgi:hypothetical protein